MMSIVSDVRIALRALARSPGFTLISILTLALGIGATTSIFSVLNGVLLRPLPYPNAHELVGIWLEAPGFGFDLLKQSETTYTIFRELNTSFEDVGLFNECTLNLVGEGDPVRVQAASVTSPMFRVLGVAPAIGRAFVATDDELGSSNVAIISDGLWRRRFGSDPGILGRTVNLDDTPREVVGIMPPSFPFPGENTELWIPHRIDPATLGQTNFSYGVIGRLKNGVGLTESKADLDRVLTRLPEFSPGELTAEAMENAEMAALVHPMLDDVVGDVGRTLWILLGTVGFILFIACANVANLFLVRAESRRREVGVRLALGAGRRNMARFFLAESAVLGLAGGVVGLGLAHAGLQSLLALNSDIPRLSEMGLHGIVLAFSAALVIATSLVFAMIPIAKYGHPNLSAALNDGGRGSSAGLRTQKLRNTLVVSQIALALVLLVGSGLMMRSYWQLRNVDPGFESQGVLTLRLSLPPAKYTDVDSIVGFYRELLDNIRGLPGVLSAGAVTHLPMTDDESNWGLAIQDIPDQPGELPPLARVKYATPGYFEAIGIPFLRGQVFEGFLNEQTAVVNTAFEEHFWPGQSALGKRIAEREGDRDHAYWYTIVGVVGDVRDDGLSSDIPKMVYFPPVTYHSDGVGTANQTMSIAIRSDGSPLALAKPVRKAVWALDPHLPVASVRTAAEILSDSTKRTEFSMLLLALAAGVALLLGAVGVYGVVSYLVSQRTQEIGVRMALGAQARVVSRMVVRQGLVISLAGVAIGLFAAWALTRLMESMLYGVSATDPLVFVGVSVMVLVVSVLASYVPARRAARVSPEEALRNP